MSKLNTIINFNLTSWPYIHDTMIPNQKLNFYGPDKFELYERNKKYQPKDWLYFKEKIVYNFNSLGLRMKKNIDDVDQEFIYFSGTSFTMGIGISEDHRFSEIISNSLSLDMINYAGPTYSIKLQVLSFFNFIKNYKKPKILIIEYPPSVGYTFFEKENAITYYSKHVPDTHYSRPYNDLLQTEFLKNESLIYKNMLQVLCYECNIKLIEISFNKNDSFVSNDMIVVDQNIIENNNINLRFGRDVFKQDGYYSGHPGIGIHKHVADEILKKL